jgi:hypothetical protein
MISAMLSRQFSSISFMVMHDALQVLFAWGGAYHHIIVLVHFAAYKAQRSVLDSISRTSGELPCLCSICLPHTRPDQPCGPRAGTGRANHEISRAVPQRRTGCAQLSHYAIREDRDYTIGSRRFVATVTRTDTSGERACERAGGCAGVIWSQLVCAVGLPCA